MVVLSHGFWQRHFGSDPAIAGKTIHLNGKLATVVGVASSDFGGLSLDVVEHEVRVDGEAVSLSPSEYKLLALLGKDEASVDYVADRLGHDRRYSVDITRITALGWKKQRTLDEALEETVAWYRDNDWWWRPLRDRAGS